MNTLFLKFAFILASITFFFDVSPHMGRVGDVYDQEKTGENVDSLIQLAQEHHMWAVKNFRKTGLLDSAIVRARLALEIREDLWKEDPTIDLGKSYHNLGVFLNIKGAYDEAKTYLKEAVSLYTHIGHDRVLRSLLELGKIYKTEGDYVSAEKYFKSVIEYAENKNIHEKIRAAAVDLGSVYILLREDSLNIRFHQNYMHLFDVENPTDTVNIGRFYNNLASAYLRKDSLDKAIIMYKRAALFDRSNNIEQAKIHTNMAAALRVKGQLNECFSALKKGEKFAANSKNVEEMAFNHKGKAKYYESIAKFGLALEEYQKAIALLLPSFRPEDRFSNPSLDDLSFIVSKTKLLSFISDKVKLLMHYDPSNYEKEILGLFGLGDRVIDEIRGDHFVNKTKLYWRSLAFPFYEEALSYCYQRSSMEEAFYFFEKSKSVLLLEGYSFNEAISQISKKDREEYYRWKTEITKLSALSHKDKFDAQVAAQSHFENFVDSLVSAYPRLFRGYQDLFIYSLTDFQNNIESDSSLYIHYFFGKDSLYAMPISQNQSKLINLGAAGSIDSLIQKLQYFYRNADAIDLDANGFYTSSYSLYQKVLSPLISQDYQELIILPDGPLSAIPFESLVSNTTLAQRPMYLIEEKMVRYSFSASILNQMQDAERRGRYDVLAFAPYDKNEKVQSNFSGIQNEDLKSEGHLNLNIKYYAGDKASKKNLLSINGRIPILHFSSHGIDNSEVGPKIELSNSYISLAELYTSSIPSDMVFLSACRTNLGELAFGEGVQSMARGFTYAGANSVISSLWNVVAGPNSKIVQSFYDNLGRGEKKHVALYNAKLSYLNDTNIPSFEKSPYYWAGLVYYGESDDIMKPQAFIDKFSMAQIAVGLLCMIIFLVGLLFIKRLKTIVQPANEL